MAITAADYHLTHQFANDDGQPFLATYFFRRVVGSGDAGDLIVAYATTISSALVPCISNVVDWVGYEAYNLVNTNDFDFASSSLSGSVTGDPMPKFVSWKIQLVRADRSFSHGWKRYPRPGESSWLGNQINPTFQATMDALLTALMSNISDGTSEFQLMIPKRTKNAEGKYVLTDLGRPSAAVFQGVSTQNTRKR